jgi:hypothetical protein
MRTHTTRQDVKSDDVMRILAGPTQNRLVTSLSNRGATDLQAVEPAVRRIVRDVRRNGDRAVRRYAGRWDGLGKREPLRVSEDEIQQAWERTDPELQDAIKQAAENIRRYAEWQAPKEWRREIQPGVSVGQFVRPLESVGCYVPGRSPVSDRFVSPLPVRPRQPWPQPHSSACASSIESAERRRSPRLPMEPKKFRAWTKSSVRATDT